MPIYEFHCLECEHDYEDLCSYDETEEYPTVVCSECGSLRKEKLVSKPAFNFSNPIGTDRWNSNANGHDYRFHHNLPNVINQRAKAEMASHMGVAGQDGFYNDIDDISSGEHFGEVK